MSSLGLNFFVFNAARLLFFLPIRVCWGEGRGGTCCFNKKIYEQTGSPTTNQLAVFSPRGSNQSDLIFFKPLSCPVVKAQEVPPPRDMKTPLLNSLLYLVTILGLLETGLYFVVEASTFSRPPPSPKRKAHHFGGREKVSKSPRTTDPESEPVPKSSLPIFSSVSSGLRKKVGHPIARSASGAYLAFFGAQIAMNWIDHARIIMANQRMGDTPAISIHSVGFKVVSMSGLHYVYPVYEPEILIKDHPETYVLQFPRIPADEYDIIIVIRLNCTSHTPPRADMTAEEEHQYFKKNRLYKIRPCEVVLPFRVKYQDILIKLSRRAFIAGDEMHFGITQLADAEDLMFEGSDTGARMYLIQFPKNGSDTINPDMTHFIGSFNFTLSSPSSRKLAYKLPDHISGFHEIVAVQEFAYSPETDIGPGFNFHRPSMSEMGGRSYIVIGRSSPFNILSKVEDTTSLLRPIEPIPVIKFGPPLGFGRFAPYGNILARNSFLNPLDLTLNRVKIRLNVNNRHRQDLQLFGKDSSVYEVEDEKGPMEGVSVRTEACLMPTGKLSNPIIRMANYKRRYGEHSTALTTTEKLSKLAQPEVPKYSKSGHLLTHKEKPSSTSDKPQTTSSLSPKTRKISPTSTSTSHEMLLPEFELVNMEAERYEGCLMHVFSMIHAKNRLIISGHDFARTSSLRLSRPLRRAVWVAKENNVILLSVKSRREWRKIIVEIGFRHALPELSRGKSPVLGGDNGARCIGGAYIPFYPIQSYEIALMRGLPMTENVMLPLHVTFDSIEPASFSGLSIFTVRVTALECYRGLDDSDPLAEVYEFTTTSTTPLITLSNVPAGSARTLLTPHILKGVRPWSRPNKVPGGTQCATDLENHPMSYPPLHSSQYACLSGNCHPKINNLKVSFPPDVVKFEPKYVPYVG